MHIGVDMDEVLSETVEEVLKFHNYKIGTREVIIEDIHDYCIWNIEGVDITFEQAKAYFKDFFIEGDVCAVKPVAGAKEKLEFFQSKGYKTTVITARRLELKDYTVKWLDKHYNGLFQDIHFAEHFTDNHKNKSDICMENDITYMIEDNFEYALDTAKAGIKTFLIERPWNRHIIHEHKNILRVKKWSEIEIIQ